MNIERIKNPLDDIIQNVFGSWDDLKITVKRAMKDAEEDEGARPGSSKFTRLVLGRCANDLSSDEFNLCMQAVNVVIGQIKKEKGKRSREIDELINEAQIKRVADDQEEEKRRTGIDSEEYNRL